MYHSLSHSKWECQYHVVFVPKFRRKVIYGQVREFLKEVFHDLARQKGCRIVAGSLVEDHVHMLIEIPPKEKVSDVVGYLKGKTAIAVARRFGGKKRNFSGESFWARGYAVSTVGYEIEKIRAYIRNQELEDKRADGNF